MANKKNKSVNLNNQWKPPVFWYCLFLFLGVYFAVAVTAVWEDGNNLFDVISKVSDALSKSIFDIGWKTAFKRSALLFKTVFLIELAVGFFILMDLTKNRNFMLGKEFGTARWANPSEINDKYENKENAHYNRVYSENLRISMEGKKTRINNNVLVIGGSGVGKSFHLLTPNLYQADANSKYPGSYIITDPKGELLQRNGALLKEKGYKVKVLNLVPGAMQESDCFNPFMYIRSVTDIKKLISNLQANTDGKDSAPSDPFWPKAEALLLQALFMIVWMEHELFNWEMNMNTVVWLMSLAEISDNPKEKSDLDKIFDELVMRTVDDAKKGFNHPAYIAYKKVMVGAADTKRSIVISVNARLSVFETEDVQRIMSKDELDLASLGTGLVDGKKDVKTALFCVIPDSDDTFNCIAGMMYTLLFQELYFQADFRYKGELPVPVTFWLDEFANIALPDNFLKMLTTMRSRQISCVIIIQNLAQIKGMWEKEWEEIPGNCDVSIYLGGNEQSTFEYISKNLGKRTIWKRSSGLTRGNNGSSSTNEDVVGRELMLPEEVRELDNDYCIVFVRGKKPVMDFKYKTMNDVNFKRSNELGAYLHSQKKNIENELKIEFISKDSLYTSSHYAGDVIECNLDESIYETPDFEELRNIAIMNYDEEQKQIQKAYVIDIANYSLEQVLEMDGFELTSEELQEVVEGINDGLSDEDIKSYILYKDVERMRSARLLLKAVKLRKENAIDLATI